MNFNSIVSSLLHIDHQTLSEYYNIFKALVSKNLFGRYKNSTLGFGWHFLSPLLLMVIYYVTFTGIRPGALPNFWIYLASGLFPFHFLISNFVGGTNVVIGNSGLVKKMYFPRELLVYAHVFSAFVILIVGYVIVFAVLLVTGSFVPLTIIGTLPLMAIMLLFSVGSCLIVSAITVYFRDFQYFLSSINLVFFFTTPMYFTLDSATGLLGTIVWFNPFTYFIDSFHQLVYYGVWPATSMVFVCVLISISTLIVGHFVFRKLKGGFAERL